MARRIQVMRGRQGFTIPELLVSMALILFIMVILTQTFVTGADMFRRLKAIGDMQERLRSVSTQLRADLKNHYLEGSPKSLSQFDFTTPTPGSPGFEPPSNGFFRIWQ